MDTQKNKKVKSHPVIHKAGKRSYKEILEIVRSVEKELKEKPELAEKIFHQPDERVF